MPATLVSCGEFSPGVGGDFERLCAQTLRDGLPASVVIATNATIDRGGGAFLECDAVVCLPGAWTILEMKAMRPRVEVFEDSLVGVGGFHLDRVFSTLDLKAKVLRSRRARAPFTQAATQDQGWIRTLVVVPDGTDIRLRCSTGRADVNVARLGDTLAHFRREAEESGSNPAVVRSAEQSWKAYAESSSRSMAASGRRLGRFKIRRELQTSAGVRCFHANDEPPSAADVLLREFAIDPTASEDQLDALLAQLAREMVVLRKLRHPNLVCVTGHFRLPASWVEVSDWFDGRPMEETWPLLSDASALEKLAVFLKVIQALEYCHERGVFHRNVTAEAVSVSDDLSDVRLGAFGLARDLSRTSTVTTTALRARDPRLVPPEELLTGATSNSRLGDVFQAGVLLYRLLENGAWPFSSSLEYATAPAHDVRPFVSSQEPETPGLRRVALQMIAPDPSERPDQLKKVERVMEGIATGRNDV